MQHDAHVLDYIEALNEYIEALMDLGSFHEAETKRAEAEELNAAVPDYDLP